MRLPTCSTKNTIVDADLKARFTARELVKFVHFMLPTEGQSYVAAYFTDEPERPIYIATRRNRKEPKMFIDTHRLLGNLIQTYPGVPLQTRLPDLEAKALSTPPTD